MSIVYRRNAPRSLSSYLSRLHALTFDLKRLNHTFAVEEEKTSLHGEIDVDSDLYKQYYDISTWKSVDSRLFGITRSMISPPIWTVLKTLRNKGFDSYLVGGCVRDLLLKRTPKDFDVVTTANLKQIKKHFHNSRIVGQRFPICHVRIRGSLIEVASFETSDKHAEKTEALRLTQKPTDCDTKDFIRWRDCMRRDFTINGLLLDPFLNKIYDYAGGMRDLRTCKVRTVIPAYLSFKEDSARILRGLRIAARLGLTFSKDTEIAIRKLSSSIVNLNKSRLMMELNFMLAYGAAESSLQLLQRFKILELLLPAHAAYLAQQQKVQSSQGLNMLMKLFFSMDKLLACDRPSDCSLWIGLLAFHLALVNNPQEALVVWTFSSALYHRKWERAVHFAREKAQENVQFVPEILSTSVTKSEVSLEEEVSQLASLVKSSIDALTGKESLVESMGKDQPFLHSDSVIIPKKIGRHVSELFDVLEINVKSYDDGRETSEINYHRLAMGDPEETRFVLGKVIMETMSTGSTEIVEVQQKEAAEKKDNLLPSSLFSKTMSSGVVEKQRQGAAEKRDKLLLSNLFVETKNSRVVEEQRKGAAEPKDKLSLSSLFM